jgi:transposase InsO family protein
VVVNRSNQVWSADITYVRMAKGFMYLVAIIDWWSRYVLAWQLSNTLDVPFCLAALESALVHGQTGPRPPILWRGVNAAVPCGMSANRLHGFERVNLQNRLQPNQRVTRWLSGPPNPFG